MALKVLQRAVASCRHHVLKVSRFNSPVGNICVCMFSRAAIADGRKIVLWQPQPAFNSSPLRLSFLALGKKKQNELRFI